MRHGLYTLLAFFATVSFTACSEEDSSSLPKGPDRPNKPIVVIYDNDVHCAVDGYAKLAGVRNSYRKQTPYVTTVSCGDFVQGDIVGSVSNGTAIIDIMNRVKYDVTTLGNHEFGFGIAQMLSLTRRLDADVVSANFRSIIDESLPFKPYVIKKYGNVDIAYLGLTTPTTLNSVAYTTFTDENGKHIYDFCQNQFYDNAQRHINEARSDGADYVIILSHLGDHGYGGAPSSISLIQNTTGINAVLDGHDHSTIADSTIYDIAGKGVLLTSTGTAFKNIGVLTLSTNGDFSSQLIQTDDSCPTDKDVHAFVEQIKEETMAQGERVVGTSEVTMIIRNEEGVRITRTEETPIGNFCADALRYVLGTDIAFMNGGAIRSEIRQGEISYNTLLSVFPYNNSVCTATMTGKQIMDALEVSVHLYPKENGGFLQVSGLKFKVDPSVPTSVVIDDNELFSHVEGSRRVFDVQVLDNASGQYVPIDPERTYTIASSSFLIENHGDYGVLRYATVKDRNLGQDVDMLAIYLSQTLGGEIGTSYGQTEGRIVFVQP
ncbi:MAG: bifunctional metallophosphatase/5'-nucleotidase [Bacteroidaceae bacterium]|nr:bifunctional metallophosphatase/5'-nucleotidase [Bacteroidaceae bacterium]